MAKVLAVPTAALLVLIACCFAGVQCNDTPEVRKSLIDFLRELAGGDDQMARDLGWDVTVPPCGGGGVQGWKSVSCLKATDGRVRAVTLGNMGARLNGTINATLLCAETAIRVLSLNDNALRGGIPAGISACKALTHLDFPGNQFSGSLPPSLALLGQLQAVDVSRNNFSGEIPSDLSKLPGLVRFLANDNHFNGTIPDFNLAKFQNFTVSNNNLTGPIPKNAERFSNQSFWPNAAGMCGGPFFDPCPASPSASSPTAPFPALLPSSGPNSKAEDRKGEDTRKKRTVSKIVMYLGYVLLGAAILAFVLYKICSKKKRSKLGRKSKLGGGRSVYDSSKLTTTTTTTSVGPSKSAYSLPTSGEHSAAAAASAPSASLVVLRRSGTASITSNAAAAAAKELRFEDLLKSPAELLGRGRFGSSYKVVVPGGAALAVKRVKDVAVNEEEFRRRMERVGSAKHPAVLPPLAFYCAMQEKLVVYEFQSNGSLAKLLHGSIESSQGPLDWPARLQIAGKVADGMAFMHTALRGDGASSNSSSGEEMAAADGPIGHGNLKASNVLFTAGMDPCISEYGVTALAPPASSDTALRADVRAFGMLLLELLTGKATPAQGDGAELARWVTSVIREEWTAEVFDRALLAGGGGDGASEQRMVRLLQVAMRCVDASPGSAPPPTMREVAGMVNAIREEDDRSFSLEA
ncbi:putative inactive receptor kinase [Dichanthelium oligosanthes]|uniref:Putative inactive receptor kinase n=1 Tax=Dichanthelium oligosanthes TaxID=888268 RepID=A0A1E5VK77_9POAL|nr:putative inactive receptor kinase [Dichanthelium oligosanthes]